MLKGEPELDPEAEEHTSHRTTTPTLRKEPLPVAYNKAIPPEFFDIIFIDECHRSIYYALAAGPGVLRRLSDRPHGDALQADARLLQPEPGDGIPRTSRPSPTA